MKARPPEYWGSKDEDLDTWIRRTERVFDANEWIENRTKVSWAKVALKGLAERWATANDHLLAPENALGRSSSVCLGLGFVHQILNRSCEKISLLCASAWAKQ